MVGEFFAEASALDPCAGDCSAAADEHPPTENAGSARIELPLPGLYNACNALAAAAAASCLGIDPELVQTATQETAGAFARFERVRVGDRQAVLLLVKNPSGFNEGLRLVLASDGPVRLLIGLNDNGPDGRDVSWIWDVDFEMCQGRTAFLAVTGQRAHDLLLRVKYAGLGDAAALTAAGPPTVPGGQLADDDIVHAFFAAMNRTPPGETLYVLASYTAMWTLRRELVQRGHLAPFWQQTQAEGIGAR